MKSKYKEKQYFDGEKTKTAFYNPWEEQVHIGGTDAGSNRPLLEESDIIPVYLSTIYKGGWAGNKGTEDYYGVDIFNYEILPSFLGNHISFPENTKYYANGPNGVHNLTSVQGIFNIRFNSPPPHSGLFFQGSGFFQNYSETGFSAL